MILDVAIGRPLFVSTTVSNVGLLDTVEAAKLGLRVPKSSKPENGSFQGVLEDWLDDRANGFVFLRLEEG